MLMASPNQELELKNLRLMRSEVAVAWADISHTPSGLYELADILIKLDEILCLEISNMARQFNFTPELKDDHHVISHVTASLWFRSMELTIIDSKSNSRRPKHDLRNMAYAEKQLE